MPGPEKDNLERRISPAMLPSSVKKGDPVSARDMNAILESLRDGARMNFVNPVTGRPILPQMVKGENQSGGTIDAWRAVEVTGFSLYDPMVIDFNVPSADGVELVAITAQQIESGKIGWLYTQGECLVQYSGAAPSTGDRLGTDSGSTIAKAVDGSNLLVIGDTTIGGTKYAVVRILPGGGADVGAPRLIRAKANMVANNIAYTCKYLTASGSEGDTLTCRRPPGTYVKTDDEGFLGQDTGENNMFIPVHDRHLSEMLLEIETRTVDPGGASTGRFWLRTDIP